MVHGIHLTGHEAMLVRKEVERGIARMSANLGDPAASEDLTSLMLVAAMLAGAEANEKLAATEFKSSSLLTEDEWYADPPAVEKPVANEKLVATEPPIEQKYFDPDY